MCWIINNNVESVNISEIYVILYYVLCIIYHDERFFLLLFSVYFCLANLVDISHIIIIVGKSNQICAHFVNVKFCVNDLSHENGGKNRLNDANTNLKKTVKQLKQCGKCCCC